MSLKFPFILGVSALVITVSVFLTTTTGIISYFQQQLPQPFTPSIQNATVSPPPPPPPPTINNNGNSNNNNNNVLVDVHLDSQLQQQPPSPHRQPQPRPEPEPESTTPPIQNEAVSPPTPAITKNDTKNVSASVVVDAMINWELCNWPAVDYIPCLDNWQAINQLKSRSHMEHHERHCPNPAPRCLLPLPDRYKLPVLWPKSRDMIWYDNVPHPGLVSYKKGQNWVRKSGEYFVFPGGGTQFKRGISHYIDFIQKTFPYIQWGKSTRVILDVGCGVASFGGYLLDKNVITLSVAPKDEHEAQIQFALERGIPATLSVIGTRKLTFPDDSFDMIHCARCRVHWEADGGRPLLELNRILRPGGYFVWSATPVYLNGHEDRKDWNAMVALTESMCWKTLAREKMRQSPRVGIVIYQKPFSYSCYDHRKENKPPLCGKKERLNSTWYAPLKDCISELPVDSMGNLTLWPRPWPERLNSKPPFLETEPEAVQAFKKDTKHWSTLVSHVYMESFHINWPTVRNVMDMNAGYGGFAAALINEPVWVMNVIPIDAQDTLPIIFDRGLIGIYHDWCESFNTYPRTYDLLHSSFLFGNLSQRCDVKDVFVEIDRIVRPSGYIVIQDTMDMINKLTPILRSLHWSIDIFQNQFLVGKKGFWRPTAAGGDKKA